MGKIRITTLGSQEEKNIKDKRKEKLEQKKKRQEAKVQVHLKGMKGGQRVKAVGAQSEEELDTLAKISEEVEKIEAEGVKTQTEEKKSKKPKKARARGKKYQEALIKLEHQKVYPIAEAIPLLKQISYAKFDETIELHINTVEKSLRGQVSLPHGTGKKLRIAVANEDNVDKLVEEIAQGKINFDALIAHPKAVAKIARVAKFLGPRGLMPNPKNNTISPEPEKIAKKMEQGELVWKTEPEFPIIHQPIGKLSFKDKELEENFLALVKSITPDKIQKITLKSTMSPGIKIQFS